MKSNRNPTNRYFVILFAFAVVVLIGLIGYYLITFQSSIIPILGLVVAFVAGWLIPFILPKWQALLNAPRLSVEITSINRTISDTAFIRIENYPKLRQLEEVVKSSPGIVPFLQQPYNLDSQEQHSSSRRYYKTLEDLIKQAERLRDSYEEQIEFQKNRLEKVKGFKSKPFAFTQFECDRLNQDLLIYNQPIAFDSQSKENTLEQFDERIQDSLKYIQDKYNQIEDLLPKARMSFNEIYAEFMRENSNFIVSVSLINAGHLHTTVRGFAVLHIYNKERQDYVPLQMKLMKNRETFPFSNNRYFAEVTVIKGNDMNVETFESGDVSKHLNDDQIENINKWWGKQSVIAYLNLEDIRSKPYTSINNIIFDEGSNQRDIYKRLSNATNDLVS